MYTFFLHYTVYNSSYAYIGLIDSNSPTGASKPSGDRYTAVPRIINGPPFWRACTVAGRPRAKISGLSIGSVQYLYSIYVDDIYIYKYVYVYIYIYSMCFCVFCVYTSIVYKTVLWQ